MGRAKLNMELITKEKSRNTTFKKRKEGLIRKMHEFTTLCDVSACMIIYAAPKQENGTAVDNQPEIWPQNIDEVRRILEAYRFNNKDSRNKEYSLSDFFHDRKRKVEGELSKLRKKNREANYPTWIESLNFTTEAGLRDFCARLRNKAEYVKSKIEFLRREKEGGLLGMGLINNHQPTPVEMHFPVFYNPDTIDHHQEMHCVNHNSMMSLLTKDGDDDDDRLSQFGVPSSSSFQRQFFFEPAVDPMVCYGPAVAAVAPPMYVMQGVAPPQLQMQFPKMENRDYGGNEDIGQYQMMNPRARYF